SDLIIIAARPGMGKTAFVLSVARNAAVKYGNPIAFFSLEMSSVQLVNRLISSETGITSDKIRKGRLESYEWEQLNSKVKPLLDAPLYIDDTPALSVFELRAKCRRLVAEKKVSMIIIDYLQLMVACSDSKIGNREQEISTISRSLKAIAKELSVPIIALSQLSRAVETRGSSKKPQLSDLRESGAIEQDADMVLFIYRPEYYELDQDENGNSTKGIAEISVAKNRNGATTSVNLKFIGSLTRFEDLDSYELKDESLSPIPRNQDADRVTRGSKMNDMNDLNDSDKSGDSRPF
ncbi:MAG: replicative DNA helicase, partial [Bacteroidota bacterium]